MTGPVLAAHEVHFSYRPDAPVLTGASLEVVGGRRLAVLGPNGGGKTTLFRLLAGALRPGGGTVLLDGGPVRHDRRGLALLRREVQLVLQDPDDQLFAASVAQDVSFGPTNMGLPRAEVQARTRGALAALGIAELADRPTHELSFGQRKRTTIAGAVAMRPRVLVLDEPTAGLDPAGVEALLVTLADLHADGTTVVVSTHDVDLAYRWADEVALVAGGTVRSGDPGELLGDRALLAAARLGPAWAPAVHRLLGRLGEPGGPRTAAELDALLRAAGDVTVGAPDGAGAG